LGFKTYIEDPLKNIADTTTIFSTATVLPPLLLAGSLTRSTPRVPARRLRDKQYAQLPPSLSGYGTSTTMAELRDRIAATLDTNADTRRQAELDLKSVRSLIESLAV
jgi:hypothetical protein